MGRSVTESFSSPMVDLRDGQIILSSSSPIFSDYELDMTNQTLEEVNAEFFQEDFAENVELTTHIGEDEYEAPISLSQGNEVEVVDPHEVKGSSERRTDIECESFDEDEEYTSDECEDDDEDEIWCVEHDRAPVLGGASVGGFCSRHQLLVLHLSLLRVSLHLLNLEDQNCYSCWSFFCVSYRGCMFGAVYTSSLLMPSILVTSIVAASVSPPLAAGSGHSTHSPDAIVGSVPEDAVSLQEGGGSFYESTLREV
ncbi:hypothetical protein Taro_044554 [Colocasia esculenta]|uniref:Uncharacterized protein n=1 Tax=Colocasia esculenta TaxID=4460 RepID=A0A843X2Y1_COLES|nr:hypothetical protein [Colocasia esculenta]